MNYGMKNSRIWPSTSTRKKHAALAHKQSLKQKCKREREISTYLRKVKLFVEELSSKLRN